MQCGSMLRALPGARGHRGYGRRPSAILRRTFDQNEFNRRPFMRSTPSQISSALILAAGVAAAALSASAALAADIKIGAPLALTGGLSDEAKKQEVTFKMWANKVNAAGGINVGGT